MSIKIKCLTVESSCHVLHLVKLYFTKTEMTDQTYKDYYNVGGC